MPRPPTLPEFASVITAGYPGRVEPNAGRKNTGYDDGEAPPAGEHNWLFGVISDWVEYLDEEATRLLLAALTDQANVFTAGQQVSVDDASVAALVVHKMASDDAEPGNLWKEELGLRFSTLGYVNIYAGTNAVDGQFLIAINAVWTPSALLWSQDDPDEPSFALIFDKATGLRLSKVPDSSAAWADWPAGNADLTLGGELRFLNAFCGAVEATSGYTAGAVGDYAYDPVKLRTTNVPLMSVAGGAATWIFSSFGEGGLSLGAGDIALFPIKLPAGARISAVEAMLDPGGASLVTLRAHRLSGHNWATPTAPTGATVDSSTTTGAAIQVISVDFGAIFVQPDEELWVSVQGAQAGDVVWGLRVVDWEDPGPRNV